MNRSHYALMALVALLCGFSHGGKTISVEKDAGCDIFRAMEMASSTGVPTEVIWDCRAEMWNGRIISIPANVTLTIYGIVYNEDTGDWTVITPEDEEWASEFLKEESK